MPIIENVMPTQFLASDRTRPRVGFLSAIAGSVDMTTDTGRFLERYRDERPRRGKAGRHSWLAQPVGLGHAAHSQAGRDPLASHGLTNPLPRPEAHIGAAAHGCEVGGVN